MLLANATGDVRGAARLRARRCGRRTAELAAGPGELTEVVADAAPRATLVEATHGAPAAVAAARCRAPLLDLQLGTGYESWLVRPRRRRAPRAARRPRPGGAAGLHVRHQRPAQGRAADRPQPRHQGRRRGAVVAARPGVLADARRHPALPRRRAELGAGRAGRRLHLGAGARTPPRPPCSGTSPRTEITHTFLVPAIIDRLCAEAPSRRAVPATSSGSLYGASPISAGDPAARPTASSARCCTQLYGMSETTGAFTEMPADPDRGRRRRRAGARPAGAYPWVEVEVRDPATGPGPARRGSSARCWTRSGAELTRLRRPPRRDRRAATPRTAGCAPATAATSTRTGCST